MVINKRSKQKMNKIKAPIGSIEYSIEYWKRKVKYFQNLPENPQKELTIKEATRILDSFFEEQERRKRLRR